MTESSHTRQEQKKFFEKKVVFCRETACSIFLTVRPKKAPYSYSQYLNEYLTDI